MAKTTDTVKAAIYARVSTEEQVADKGNGGEPTRKVSLDFQKERAAAYCALKGWDVAEIYEDAGVSGAKANRPALDRLMADVHQGKFQRVVFLKLDRLGRNLRDLLNISARLDELGVGIVSVHDNFDTGTPSGRLYFSMLGAVAEFERDLISERMSMGRLGAARNGRYVGGPAPYGYDYNRETHQLVVNETEAAVVRRIYRTYIDEGLSHDRIAERLNAEGVPTKTTRVRSEDGKKKGWMRTHITRMLTNSLYKGTTHYGKTRLVGGQKRTRQPQPSKEWIEIAVPAIVAEEQWLAVQRRARRNKRESQRPRDKANAFLLSGLMRCQECGRSMAATTNRTRAGGKVYAYRYYFCTGQHTYGTECRTPYRVKAEEIEGKVLGLLMETFSDPDKVLEACRAYGKQLQTAQEEQRGVTASLRRHLARAGVERERYIELFGKGTIGEADLQRRLAHLDAEVAKWQEELRHLEVAAQQEAAVREIEESAHAIAARIGSVLGEMTLEERKELVRALVERIWLDADNSITMDCIVPGLISDRTLVTTSDF